MIELNSCSSLSKKEPNTVVISDYCSLIVPIPEGEEDKILDVNDTIYANVRINNTTETCNCRAPKEKRKQCWEDFDNLNKEKNAKVDNCGSGVCNVADHLALAN